MERHSRLCSIRLPNNLRMTIQRVRKDGQAHANGIESFLDFDQEWLRRHLLPDGYQTSSASRQQICWSAYYPTTGHGKPNGLHCQMLYSEEVAVSGIGVWMKPTPTVNSNGTGRRVAPKESFTRSKRLIAFGWYGGKFSHLDFILPHIPKDASHFCDVFGGSAAVMLNLPPYPAETYNDLDSELVNFFFILRNQGTDLLRAIGLTPFSREELMLACTPEQGLSRLERARRFFVRARQTRTGLGRVHTNIVHRR